MTMHLAQVNVAAWAVDPDGPEAASFVAEIEPVNSLVDAAPGFVWRLRDEHTDNAVSIEVLGDPMLLVNLSVWESLSSLLAFVRDGRHADVMRRRREWFRAMKEAHAVLWWVPVGHHPSIEEAERRLAYLREHGPSEHAFTFGRTWPPPVQ